MAEEQKEPTREECDKVDKEAREKEKAEQDALPYKWTQTIQDVDIAVPVPANIKGRDLDVVLTKTKLKVALKGQTPLIDVCSLAIAELKAEAVSQKLTTLL